jgi:hypothetical protein
MNIRLDEEEKRKLLCELGEKLILKSKDSNDLELDIIIDKLTFPLVLVILETT